MFKWQESVNEIVCLAKLEIQIKFIPWWFRKWFSEQNLEFCVLGNWAMLSLPQYSLLLWSLIWRPIFFLTKSFCWCQAILHTTHYYCFWYNAFGLFFKLFEVYYLRSIIWGLLFEVYYLRSIIWGLLFEVYYLRSIIWGLLFEVYYLRSIIWGVLLVVYYLRSIIWGLLFEVYYLRSIIWGLLFEVYYLFNNETLPMQKLE